MHPSAADQAVLDDVAQRFAQRDPVVEALTGGLGNRSWRMSDDGRDLVVRIGTPHAGVFGVNRHDEVLAQSAAATHGLAPPVLWHDAAAGLLVTDFVAGRGWTRVVARQPVSAARCGEWLHGLHRVPLPTGIARVDYAERAKRLGGSLPRDALTGRLYERAAAHRHGLGDPTAPVLCHHDLHHLNIVDCGTRLVALDWEYAGAGEPLMDLAGYAAYHDLDETALAALLRAYAAGGPPVSGQRLAAARWLFEFVWLLWLETRRLAESSESRELAATRRRLMARLEAVHDG